MLKNVAVKDHETNELGKVDLFLHTENSCDIRWSLLYSAVVKQKLATQIKARIIAELKRATTNGSATVEIYMETYYSTAT